MRAARWVLVVAALAVVAACARGGGTDGRLAAGESSAPTTGERSAPPEAYVQRADGTVPWVDEQISTADLFGPPRAPRTASAGSKPCRAAQLTAVLTGWKRPSYGGEKPRGFDTAIGHLIGEVDIRNTSASECTLRGEVPTRMIAGGREVPMLYTHGINDEAHRRLTVVPAGGHASLRLDWSGPFCQPLEGALELAIELPDHGGTLRGPVTATDMPGCARGEGVNPNARATLSAPVSASRRNRRRHRTHRWAAPRPR
jgi:hypothetical protein